MTLRGIGLSDGADLSSARRRWFGEPPRVVEDGPRCRVCGQPVRSYEGGVCEDCTVNRWQKSSALRRSEREGIRRYHVPVE